MKIFVGYKSASNNVVRMRYTVFLLLFLVSCSSPTVEYSKVVNVTETGPSTPEKMVVSPEKTNTSTSKETVQTKEEVTVRLFLDLFEDGRKYVEAETFWDLYIDDIENYAVTVKEEEDSYIDEALRCAQPQLSQEAFNDVVVDVFDSDMSLETVSLRLLQEGVDVQNKHVLYENMTKRIGDNHVLLRSIFRDEVRLTVDGTDAVVEEEQEGRVRGRDIYVNAVVRGPAMVDIWVDSCLFDVHSADSPDYDVLADEEYDFDSFSEDLAALK